MDANETTLTLFTTRLRQLILEHKETKKENEKLQAKVDEHNARIKELEEQLQGAHRKYEDLKMAKMLEITNQDMDSARKRLAKLIRDVNKCITLLSEKNLENG